MNRFLTTAALCLALLSCSRGGETIAGETSASGFCHVKDGVLYNPEGKPLSLWGVNFQTPLSWEANRLGKAGVQKTEQGLNAVTDNNLDDVVRLGANLLRCHLTPADFTDAKGNLTETAYLHALDYLVARAGEKGISLCFAFLNHMGQKGPGAEWAGKGAETWIHDPDVVRCTANYISQLVKRVNPCNGIAYKDNKSIVFWELVNEPEMYSYSEISDSGYAPAYKSWLQKAGKDDTAANYAAYRTETVRSYIDGMVKTLRDAGDGHPVCWGLNWHRFRRDNKDLFDGVVRSKADIVSFCNYPGQDYVERNYSNYRYDFTDRSFSDWFNKYFSMEDGYGWARTKTFAPKAKVAYEFETFFNQSGYLYPVQALYIKALGGQAATMWTYTFAEIAPLFGGSHFLNLRCTPAKAASFMVASRIFHSTKPDFPIKVSDEMSGDGWCISKQHNAAVYSDGEYYCTSGETLSGWSGIKPSAGVKHISGLGSSPLVTYSGSGIYFIDETDSGLLINLMPDIVIKGDRFFKPDYQTTVTELVTTVENTLSISLDRWKDAPGILYSVDRDGNRTEISSYEGTGNFKLKPGLYIFVRK